ncbi:S16 family serine protease [Pseudonocardia sp. T1-2H]|uniref:S16 family serine protease n=1 Tax=Pseudonocardia sp. T1-2H TaxID=3128899 RepID=UPI0031011572
MPDRGHGPDALGRDRTGPGAERPRRVGGQARHHDEPADLPDVRAPEHDHRPDLGRSDPVPGAAALGRPGAPGRPAGVAVPAGRDAGADQPEERPGLHELPVQRRRRRADLPEDADPGVRRPAAPGVAPNGVLETGDQILAVDGRPVDSVEDVRAALAGTTPGQQVPVRILRGDAIPTDVMVTLTRLGDSAQGALGIGPVAKPETDDEITISLSGIGGPSAGLMFALAVVDKLTPGELTGGHNIAGTGEITSEGTVGPIGGIGLKLIGAQRAGATVFLVPGKNCEEARADAPAGLQLVRVDTLTDAVQDLDMLRAGQTPSTC